MHQCIAVLAGHHQICNACVRHDFDIALSVGWEGEYKITEYSIEGADSGERMYVAFDQPLNPDSCQGDGQWVQVNGDTEKGKHLFSIILSAHASKQSVSPKL